MTEYKCSSADTCQFGKMCKPNYDISACSHYKAEEPQTNDEWRKTCSTEEFAEFLNFIAFDWNRVDKQWVLEWLKQPHKQKGD